MFCDGDGEAAPLAGTVRYSPGPSRLRSCNEMPRARRPDTPVPGAGAVENGSLANWKGRSPGPGRCGYRRTVLEARPGAGPSEEFLALQRLHGAAKLYRLDALPGCGILAGFAAALNNGARARFRGVARPDVGHPHPHRNQEQADRNDPPQTDAPSHISRRTESHDAMMYTKIEQTATSLAINFRSLLFRFEKGDSGSSGEVYWSHSRSPASVPPLLMVGLSIIFGCG